MSSQTSNSTRPLSLAHDAAKVRFSQPSFAERPEGAPHYYGFPALPDVIADGFTMGKITDFESQPAQVGDSFVIAPDGNRCGLVWMISSEPGFMSVVPPENDRWGVWAVNFPFPMTNRENARQNLKHILPRLQEEWIRWRTRG